jgi:hypothetical protein
MEAYMALSLCRVAVLAAAHLSVIGCATDLEHQAPDHLRSVEHPFISPDMLQRQQDYLAALPAAQVTYSKFGPVSRLEEAIGLSVSERAISAAPGDPGGEVLQLLGPALLATGSENLAVRSVRMIGDRFRVLEYEQRIDGIPVLGGVTIGVDLTTLEIKSVSADFLPDRGVRRTPVLSARAATDRLVEMLVASDRAREGSVVAGGEPSLAYLGGSTLHTRIALVWMIEVNYATQEGQPNIERFFVNSADGMIEGSVPLLHRFFAGAYSAQNVEARLDLYPAGLVFLPQLDSRSTIAKLHLESVERAWHDLHDPLAQIGPVSLVVHYGSNYINAHHSVPINGPGHWLSFGDGDGNHRSPAELQDAVAHEWGHGLFNFTNASAVETEVSSMQEAYADFSSVVVDFWRELAATPPVWEIGENSRSLPTLGMRSWFRPMLASVTSREWYPARRVSGEGHDNTTIMGHAFYLLSQGGLHERAGLSGIPVIAVPPIGFNAAELIFWEARRLPAMSNPISFFDLRSATESAASMLYGEPERAAVRAAWDAVGVGWSCSGPPPVPHLIVTDRCSGRFNLRWNAVPGATTYHAQRVPDGFPWSLAAPIVDGPVLSCLQQVSSPAVVRLRACNGCGCSAWDAPRTLIRFQQCQ